MKMPTVRAGVGTALALLFVAALVWWPLGGDSVLVVSARWIVVTIIVAALLIWLAPKVGFPGKLAERVEVLSAFFTASAIVVAAVVYFLERRNQAQLAGGLEATVIRPMPGDGQLEYVLLAIRVPVENKGHRKVLVQCMGVDVLRPVLGGPLRRSATMQEEMHMRPLSEQIRYGSDDSLRCLRAEEKRKKMPQGSIRPLYMWDALSLEPNEVDDRHFEIAVSCRIPFVRIISKMRISPEDPYVQESKMVVSLWDACRGETGSSSAAQTPSIQADAHGISEGAKPSS